MNACSIIYDNILVSDDDVPYFINGYKSAIR